MDEITTMVFSFKDMVFENLKLKKNKDNLPWSTKQEETKYLEDLVEEGSHYSKMKYLDALNVEFEEDIHVRLSYSIILNFLSYLFLAFTLIFMYYKLVLLTGIIFGVSIIFKILQFIFKRLANESYMGKSMTSQFIDLIFYKEDE